jgi:hypothetical protein
MNEDGCVFNKPYLWTLLHVARYCYLKIFSTVENYKNHFLAHRQCKRRHDLMHGLFLARNS